MLGRGGGGGFVVDVGGWCQCYAASLNLLLQYEHVAPRRTGSSYVPLPRASPAFSIVPAGSYPVLSGEAIEAFPFDQCYVPLPPLLILV